jgi:hypothetical protein
MPRRHAPQHCQPRKLQLAVQYFDNTCRYFPIDPDQGWKLDPINRQIVVGRGVPRTMIPLDGVRYYDIEEYH